MTANPSDARINIRVRSELKQIIEAAARTLGRNIGPDHERIRGLDGRP